MNVQTLFLLFTLLSTTFASAQGVRLKDLTNFVGVRSNDLVGYGLVVGLDGTGDGLRNAPFTEEMMSNTLERLGVNVSGEKFGAKNVAAVIVTGQLLPFARTGSTLDVTVSAIGDASSLRGGTLIMTPLKAPDGRVYAVAQGTIISGGVSAEGQAAKITQGVPTSGSIPAGARVEAEVDFELRQLEQITIALKMPDFSTAQRIERAINFELGEASARMLDPGTIRLDINGRSTANLLARIENLRIQPETQARVIVDQKSGTIVITQNVLVSSVAISKENMTVKIEERPLVQQPNPFTEAETVVVPRTRVDIEREQRIALAEIPTTSTLADLISGLNALGVTTTDLIDVLKTIKAAGALHAEFSVQ